MKFFKCLIGLLFTLTLLTDIISNQSAQAQMLSQTVPVFGLFSDENVIKSGKVEFDLSDSSLLSQNKAILKSEFVVTANNRTVEFAIPFISSCCALPPLTVTVNGNQIDGEIWYGESYCEEFDNSEVYSPVLDESLAGTLYTIYPSGDSVTVKLKLDKSQSYIYDTSNHFVTGDENGVRVLKLYETVPEYGYKIFITGECVEDTLSTEAEYESEKMSCKYFIDMQYAEYRDFYVSNGTPTVDYIYSQMNRILTLGISCCMEELFFDYFNLRTNAYKFKVQVDGETVIKYSSQTKINEDFSFSPSIFLLKSKKALYPISYAVKLNEEYPYIVDSSIPLENEVYSTETTDDFYMIYSSAKKPDSKYYDNEDNNRTVIITVSCAIVCVLVGVCLIIIFKAKSKHV